MLKCFRKEETVKENGVCIHRGVPKDNTSAICKMLLKDFKIQAAVGKRRGCQQKGKYGKYKFKYIPDWDVYICPERNYLKYVTTDRNGFRDYKCKNDRCGNCTKREKCLSEKKTKAGAIMCGKIIGMRYMYSHILTRVRKYTQNKKRKSSAALQNQKSFRQISV